MSNETGPNETGPNETGPNETGPNETGPNEPGSGASGLVHPFSKALYELDGTGNVRVVDGDRWGRFTLLGEWLEGEVRFADPQMCGWVGGARVRHHRLQVRDD